MAITRTALGTQYTAGSGTTLTISGVTVKQGSSLVVGIGNENTVASAPDTVTINGRSLKRKQQQANGPASIHASVWIKPNFRKEQTGDIVATWGSSIGKRAMFASSFDTNQRKDQSASQADTPTTTPGTGITAALSSDADMAVCLFVSAGPRGDTAATGATIDDAGSPETANIGQRDGTAGAPAAGNVTVQETWLQLTATDATQGALSGATSRRWASCVIALSPGRYNEYGVTTGDLHEMRRIFDDKTPDLDEDNALWHWNEELDRWELYEQTGSKGTLIAHSENMKTIGEWTVV